MRSIPLEQRGHQIGSPYHSHDGVRFVQVDNFPWADDAVFEEIWVLRRAKDY
jgi:hypothetical protein